MKVHKLQPNIIANIRSSSTINSTTQCITELVLNSLDAKSTAIAIRINLVNLRIQVVDNGDGFTKHNINRIGPRYMTSKCNNINQLQSKLDYYGFRGEALASIINNSRIVEITSKHKNSLETFNLRFNGGIKNITNVKNRPSYGTTVTVEDFLYNFPLRKNHIIPEIELLHIKKNIESLIIIHPHVSFSLRNDVTGDLILNNRKCKDIISAFMSLHPEVNNEYILIKVSKNNITMKGLLFKEMFENKNMQYVYVNRRPVKCSKVQVFIQDLLQKTKSNSKDTPCLNSSFANERHKYPIYVLNISCPYDFVDILLSPTKTMVEFQNWDIVFNCIEKLVFSFLGKTNKDTKQNLVISCKSLKRDCGTSQMHGMVKGFGFKRKHNVDENNSSPLKKQKLINDKVNSFIDIDNFAQMISFEKVSTKENNIVTLTTEKKLSKVQSDTNNYKYNKRDSLSYKKKTRVNNIMHGTKEFALSVTDLPTFIDSSRLISTKKNCNKRSYEDIALNKCDTVSVETNPEDYNVLRTYISGELTMNTFLIENPLLSKFTNDENKGKHLIMEMFLKSTQVYSSDTADESDKNSEGTVFEVESKYLLANNITTNINGKNKTMSVSVNITKRIKKKYKKKKRLQMTSKLIQTTLDKNEMISKCVQTSPQEKHTIHNVSNDTKLAENCTIILSTTRRVPYFKFIHQTPIKGSYIFSQIPYETCQCNDYKKAFKTIFNLTKNKHNSAIEDNTCHNLKEINKFGTTEIICRKENYLKNSEWCVNVLENTKNATVKKLITKNLCGYRNSPYFLKRQNDSHLTSVLQKINGDSLNKSLNISRECKLLKTIQNSQTYNLFNKKWHTTKNKDNNMSCITKRKYQHKHSSIHSEFSKIANKNSYNFKETHKNPSTTYTTHNIRDTFNSYQSDKIMNLDNRDHRSNDESKKENMFYHDLIKSHPEALSEYQPNKTTSDFTKLFITLSNRQKEHILRNELNTEKNTYNQINLEWESQMKMYNEKQEDIEQEEFQELEERIRKENNFETNFCINRKTGFSTFCTPKALSNKFKLSERYDFVPKGLSPILRKFKDVEKILSQNKKDKLEAYIMENYQNESHVTKWQHYLKNHDSKTFFEEMYQEKLNSFEHCIPKTIHFNKYDLKSNSMCFDKTLFNNIRVIGQVDRKFIVVLEEIKCLIILFDQHAAHERIRLEVLLKEWPNIKTLSSEDGKLEIFMSHYDLSLLKKHEKYLKSLGLYLNFFEGSVHVKKIPSCLYSRFKNDGMHSLNATVQLVIKEIIENVKKMGVITLKCLPKIILNSINLEACRGAIKFGDKLTHEDCQQLLQKLSVCNLPFQCAHGRPTLMPLVGLNLENVDISRKVNLKKLLG